MVEGQEFNPRLLNLKCRGGYHGGNFKIRIKDKEELITLMRQLDLDGKHNK